MQLPGFPARLVELCLEIVAIVVAGGDRGPADLLLTVWTIGFDGKGDVAVADWPLTEVSDTAPSFSTWAPPLDPLSIPVP